MFGFDAQLRSDMPQLINGALRLIEKLSTMLDFIRVKILRIIFIVDIALLLLKRIQTFSCFVKRSLGNLSRLAP